MNHAVTWIIEKGFKAIGKGCMISPLAVIRNPEAIEIGDNCRIDEWSLIDGGAGLKIGNHCHVSNHCSIFTGAGIELQDFVNMAPYALILSESDDFGGGSMVGPQIDRRFKPGYRSPGPIVLGRHVTVGARTTIMPGASIAAGVAIGAHSLVRKPIDKQWTVWAGVPAKFMKPRRREMDELSEHFLDWFRNGERK